jgi:hypothetical protein
MELSSLISSIAASFKGRWQNICVRISRALMEYATAYTICGPGIATGPDSTYIGIY